MKFHKWLAPFLELVLVMVFAGTAPDQTEVPPARVSIMEYTGSETRLMGHPDKGKELALRLHF